MLVCVFFPARDLTNTLILAVNLKERWVIFTAYGDAV